MRTIVLGLAAVGLAIAAAACHEIPQDARKPFAAKADVEPWTGDKSKGDQQKFEQSLAERANYENEYLRTGEPKK